MTGESNESDKVVDKLDATEALRLQHLYLASNGIGPPGIAALASALRGRRRDEGSSSRWMKREGVADQEPGWGEGGGRQGVRAAGSTQGFMAGC